jgi:hypothetical protein
VEEKWLLLEVIKLMHHPYVLERLEHDRRNDLLREADSYRLLRQAARGRTVQANLLRRIVSAINGLLIRPEGQLAKKDSRFMDKAITGEYR